jgi:ATP-dependent DNA helicase RecG
MLNELLSKLLKTKSTYIKKLDFMGIKTGLNLLEYFPRKIEQNHSVKSFNDLKLGEKNNLVGILSGFETQKTKLKKTIYKSVLYLSDNTAIEVVWFKKPYQLKNFTGESSAFLIGKVVQNYGILQIQNPEVYFEKNIHNNEIRPIYIESLPITSKWIREKVQKLLNLKNDIKTILPQQILKDEQILAKSELIKRMHFPQNLEEWTQARQQLGFEELFIIQVRVLQNKILRELNQQKITKISINSEKIITDYKKLPFELTGDQKKALSEIYHDLEQDIAMHRLLQGDVGSGKTIVAFLSTLQILRNKQQVAILAPTEILAKQHYQSFLKFIELFKDEDFGQNNLLDNFINTELLIGSITNKQKIKIRENLRLGNINVVIGTHAILTDDTVFNNLGLAIIDEQHRFGVKQRNIIAENNCHVLSMTATPIPRTLSLTIYGDQSLSIIKEKPAGRKEIITRVIATKKNRRLCKEFIADQIKKGHQVFWICPLVEESTAIEAKNVLSEVKKLQKLYPEFNIGFLHGKMKTAEKDNIMNQFKNHEFDILVATSVVEVGVDIPNSTVMVIENSERFGLSQLHQFRGRIGRNSLQSYCFLMTGKIEDKNKARLKAMEKSNDGFYLAEIDLQLRGAGDTYGIKQSGLPDLKCAEIGDIELMKKSRYWAERLLKKDLYLEHFPLLKTEIENTEIYFQ